jgi:hypothetical protein
MYVTAGVRSGWTGHCIGSLSLNHHTMEVEQMMAHLLAEIRTSRVKMDANQAKVEVNPR